MVDNQCLLLPCFADIVTSNNVKNRKKVTVILLFESEGYKRIAVGWLDARKRSGVDFDDDIQA